MISVKLADEIRITHVRLNFIHLKIYCFLPEK